MTEHVARYSTEAQCSLDDGTVPAALASLPVCWADAAVLDLGCGSGTWGVAARALGARRVVFQDISQDFLSQSRALAERHGITDAEFVEADMTRLPYLDGAFDVVICALALHFASDEERTIREVARVLRPGGVFFLADSSWKRTFAPGGLTARLKRLLTLPLPWLGVLGWKPHPGCYVLRFTVDRRCRAAGLRHRVDIPTGHRDIFWTVYRHQ